MTKDPTHTGPRGGKSTVSPGGLIKKSFWVHPDEVAMLRRAAFEQDRSQADLVREAIRAYFDMEKPSNGPLTEALASHLRADPDFQRRLREFLADTSADPREPASAARDLLGFLDALEEQRDGTG